MKAKQKSSYFKRIFKIIGIINLKEWGEKVSLLKRILNFF